MSIKTIALAGVGTIGTSIAEELLKAKAAGDLTNVVLITRKESPASCASTEGSTNTSASQFASKGAKLAAVDYTDPESLESALKGVDAVVSTLSAPGLASAQIALAEAAKKAGVKLFAPSEFGDNNDGRQASDAHLGVKLTIYSRLDEIQLPWIKFYTGIWPDFCFVPQVGFDFENGKATVGGDGNMQVSMTMQKDVASFVAHALTKFPMDDLANKVIRMEGTRKSFNEIAQLYEKKHSKKIEMTYVSVEDLKAKIAADPNDLVSFLHHDWAIGRGAVGKPDELANGKWPEWNPTQVEDVL